MGLWTKALLACPGIHYFVTRFGTARLRAASFDQKFQSGRWNFTLDRSAELVSVVERYAGRGHILMVGCGAGSLAGALAPEAFATFTGIDISPEAIKRASAHASDKIRFAVADCTTYVCAQVYDVILFSESLYYISPGARKPLLEHFAGSLTPTGHLIVTIADPGRYAAILHMIRKEFCITEDRSFHSSSRHLLVFR